MKNNQIIAKFLKAQLVALNSEYDEGYINDAEFALKEMCLRDCLLEVGVKLSELPLLRRLEAV
tara:strand:+ start:893 stop:1081 length:189 start_codon:yes stop_codon:yes gene_type:complete